MARLYTVTFTAVAAIGATQDFFEVVGSAGKLVKLKRVKLSATDSTIPTSQMVQISIGMTTATAALGTGTAGTLNKTDQGDSAQGFTFTNNTTVIGTGTRIALIQDGFHVFNGYDEGSIDPAQPPLVMASGTGEGFFVELLQAVLGTVHFSGTFWVEESNA